MPNLLLSRKFAAFLFFNFDLALGEFLRLEKFRKVRADPPAVRTVVSAARCQDIGNT